MGILIVARRNAMKNKRYREQDGQRQKSEKFRYDHDKKTIEAEGDAAKGLAAAASVFGGFVIGLLLTRR